MHWYIHVLKNYVNFSGRAHRTEYWMFTLVNVIISLILGVFIAIISGSNPYHPIRYLETIYSLGILLPSLAVCVRRLHDTDRSGLWLLPQFIAIPLIMVLALSTLGSPHGAEGTFAFIGLIAIGLAIYSIVLLIFFVSSGTDGPNRFGPDPWEADYDDGDEYYDDDDEYYDDEYDEPRRPGRSQAAQPQRRSQQSSRSSNRPQSQQAPTRRYNPEQRHEQPQKDIYNLNESFREAPPPRAQPRTRQPMRMEDEALSDYKNPFSSEPSDQEKKQFDRFGLVDDHDFSNDPPRQPPSASRETTRSRPTSERDVGSRPKSSDPDKNRH